MKLKNIDWKIIDLLIIVLMMILAIIFTKVIVY